MIQVSQNMDYDEFVRRFNEDFDKTYGKKKKKSSFLHTLLNGLHLNQLVHAH